jgi:hypothetical protein
VVVGIQPWFPKAVLKSLGLYRECAGDGNVGSKIRLIAGAFPIQPLALSRLNGSMGIGFRLAARVSAVGQGFVWRKLRNFIGSF